MIISKKCLKVGRLYNGDVIYIQKWTGKEEPDRYYIIQENREKAISISIEGSSTLEGIEEKFKKLNVGRNKTKTIDILNDSKYQDYENLFRSQCLQRYPATEIAFINRYLQGEITLIPDKDFSKENLELILSLQEK
jgi:hypothetical protein